MIERARYIAVLSAYNADKGLGWTELEVGVFAEILVTNPRGRALMVIASEKKSGIVALEVGQALHNAEQES